jgi:hypothetical protein
MMDPEGSGYQLPADPATSVTQISGKKFRFTLPEDLFTGILLAGSRQGEALFLFGPDPEAGFHGSSGMSGILFIRLHSGLDQQPPSSSAGQRLLPAC